MERHRIGPDDRDVSAIGQGTWYIDSGDRASAVAALRRGMNLIETAECTGTRKPLPPRRSWGGATRSSSSPRSSRRTPRGAGRSRPASGHSPACGPTASTAISCTGAARNSLSVVGAGEFAPRTTGYRLRYLSNSLVWMSILSLTLTYLMQVYSALRERNVLGLKLHLASGETGDAARPVVAL